MTRGDLERSDLNELDWSSEEASASMTQVFEHAVGVAADAEDWYAAKRRPKRRWGQALRVGAIVLGAAAAVIPILAQISTSDGTPSIAPGWAAVALAGTAALVALDRYFGLTAGWMRFMTAELQIKRLRHEFEYAWQDRRASMPTPPSKEDVRRQLTAARDLVLAVDDAIADETGSWITEFRTSLEQVEHSLARAEHP